MEQKIIHKFEEAGLGIAPFDIHAVVMADWSNCEFCGTGIKEHCYIKDVNGKIFLVGNECVKHTGDSGLVDVVKREVNKLRTEIRHRKEEIKINTARATLFNFAKVRTELLNRFNYKADFWYKFTFGKLIYGGTSYKLDLAKKVSQIAEEVLTEEERKGIISNLDTFYGKIQEILDAEKIAQEKKLQEEREANKLRLEKIKLDNAELIQVLGDQKSSSFINDMIWKLGHCPISSLSMRQVEVLSEIYGKSFGKVGSKEYQDAYASIYIQKRDA